MQQPVLPEHSETFLSLGKPERKAQFPPFQTAAGVLKLWLYNAGGVSSSCLVKW